MRVNDGECLDLMDQFEKDVKKIIYGHKFDRITRIDNKPIPPASVFYDDGFVNTLFQSYMLGYSNAKCLRNLDALPD